MASGAEGLRDRLIQIHDEARAARHHQIAYHALAGVLHAGEVLADLPTLEMVNERATDYARWLQREDPKHPLSPQSAAQRGHPGVFDQLAATAAAVRARIKAEKLTKEKGRP